MTDATTTPPTNVVTRTIHVPVKLTDAEIVMRSRSLVAAQRELANVKHEAKAAAKASKEKIETKELEIERLNEIVESGRERRPLVCARRTVPERGMLEWVHLETMDVVDTEPLLPPEDDDDEEPQGETRQPPLPFPSSTPTLAFAGVDEWGQVHEISAEQRDQLQMAIAEKRSLRCTLADGREVKLVAIHTEDGKADGVRSPCDACGLVDGNHRPDCTATKGDDMPPPDSQRTIALKTAAEKRKAKWHAKGVKTDEDGCPIGVDVEGHEYTLTDAEGDELAELGAVEIDDPETTCISFAEPSSVDDAPDYSAAAKIAEEQKLVQTKPRKAKKNGAGAEAGK